MVGKELLTEKVFGVSNEHVESYIEREHVDAKFKTGLYTKKHIIVYGASKQGKTALTNKHLSEEDYIRVDCAPNSEPIDLYKSVLRQLNVQFQLQTSTENTTSSTPKIGFKAKVEIPLIGSLEAGAEESSTTSKKETITYSTVEFNLELAQDISEILKSYSFKKRIILENFHYLNENTQKQLAFDLRIFEDHNILFIILGIWKEKNRLSQFNGDLQDRMLEVPVEPWETKDLKRVLREGEPLLNISFNKIEKKLISATFDSIGVFQELCKHCCLQANISKTKSGNQFELEDIHLTKAVESKLEDYSSRHIRSIETFIEQKSKSSDETPLFIAYYFVLIILRNNSDLTKGLKRTAIHEMIQKEHHRPEDVRSSDIGYFLHNIVATQIKKSIIPPIFDYDRSTRSLKVIDSTFYFFLKNIDCKEFEEELDRPLVK